MGKRPIVRRRGAGTKWTALGFRYKGDSSYLPYTDEEKKGYYSAKVEDIIHDPGRTAPLMVLKYKDKRILLPAPLGVSVGQEIQIGAKAEVKPGNILPLAKIPDGTIISNIELRPSDGGKLIRSAGTAARVVLHEGDEVIIQLPSKQFKRLSGLCRAMVGTIAGSGRHEKPFVKAGNKFKAMKARGKLYPRVSANAMNAVDHKFGGKRAKKPKTVSRNAPPGRKIGSIAAKRTGRKKR